MISQVTTALQVNATTGNGEPLFLREIEVRYVSHHRQRISHRAGVIIVECCLHNAARRSAGSRSRAQSIMTTTPVGSPSASTVRLDKCLPLPNHAGGASKKYSHTIIIVGVLS